jgi:hypothetical protein
MPEHLSSNLGVGGSNPSERANKINGGTHSGGSRPSIDGCLGSMEHFSTSRLTAERLHEGHLADLVALHLDPDVSRYLGGVRSPEETETYLTVNIAHWERHGFGLWVLRTHTGEFAGRAGIRASRHILEKSGFSLERCGIYHREEVVIYRSPIAVHVPGNERRAENG